VLELSPVVLTISKKLPNEKHLKTKNKFEEITSPRNLLKSEAKNIVIQGSLNSTKIDDSLIRDYGDYGDEKDIEVKVPFTQSEETSFLTNVNESIDH